MRVYLHDIELVFKNTAAHFYFFIGLFGMCSVHECMELLNYPSDKTDLQKPLMSLQENVFFRLPPLLYDV